VERNWEDTAFAELARLLGEPDDWESRQLPPRYRSASLEMLDPGRQKAVQEYVAQFTAESPLGDRERNGLLVYGGAGVGKTFMAAVIGKEIARKLGRRHWPIWREVHKLAQQLRDELGNTASPSRWIRDSLVDPEKLLILDDLGAERDSDFLAEQLEAAIVRRYDEQLPVLITTNLDPEGIKARYGTRVFSRLWQMCRVVHLTGPDRRLT